MGIHKKGEREVEAGSWSVPKREMGVVVVVVVVGSGGEPEVVDCILVGERRRAEVSVSEKRGAIFLISIDSDA